ncbi:hypothetical protein JCGZ_09465 [Jatropha curcas]|uniref:Prolamin-like domain-containing protein n=1 Tax=Jatropha curcas TaxID=180498 RepID=A0A067KGG4_JATCU|nr:egg cell-secreted protein 1.4 [Jatropha curcas]KDP35306.1 hypothetical protein JCGZ_09465 [Jatropha curcas]
MAFKIVFLIWGLILVISSGSAARDVPMIKSGEDYERRLVVDGSSSLVDCWNALIEIKSCSNEIILFFLNGKTDIGPECCRSIGIITHNCWPAMLTSLGFTAEEGNVLRGYCDASSFTAPAPAPASAPAAVASLLTG